MPAYLKHTATGGSYAATIQRLSDGFWFTPGNSSFAANPVYADKRISLVEGTGELVGSHTATVANLSGVGNVSEPGLVRIRIHDQGASNATIVTEDFFVYQGNLVRSDVPVSTRASASDIAGALLTAITNPSTGIILPELTSVPPSTPTIAQAMMLTYMAIRNRGVSTAKTDRIYNDAGLPVFEAAITDDGVTFTRERITSVLV